MPKKTFNLKKSRILEPLILGILANILINLCFNPKHPDFIFKEFLVAIVFATIITELTRYVSNKLDKKLNWSSNFKLHLLLNFIVLSALLLLIINGIGNLYIYFSGDTFHTLDETLLINLIVLSIVLISSLIKWCFFLYNKWVLINKKLNNNLNENLKLKSLIVKSSKEIELVKGNFIIHAPVSKIRYAIIESGVINVYNTNKKLGSFNGSLTYLESQLPECDFFKLSRHLITHKEGIKKIRSSTYGKIEIELNNELIDHTIVTVSRLKAAKFRQWYSSSVIN
ncbi:LytTR family transcriptional regulator DNA-binding domain-containing protein [uncultured Psychroserpens sp.]|uniref:LytTR family transcriptional regulator DNA-binding domain-containing protein n=1 Tax=uncultured Psychroserpens sp. TaxID=255436 RepID=UPI002606477D|nr:LytTR family transcriptional regulator DNA-binding domain-containing protein [uncultured Psychroserpens sp.]